MIPTFDHNNVLPPYSGVNPALNGSLSPYPTDIWELCNHFATSKARIDILKGFVNFRIKCVAFGITGFQWIDGSFVENIEVRENRDPHDIDVVSFVFNITPIIISNVQLYFEDFIDPSKSKAHFLVDHYIIEADKNPLTTIEGVRYWNQLFGHNRDGIWKGMLQLPLTNDDLLDKRARDYLNTL